ncbi:hypothetical protein HDU96_010686 [Phlyctochytrium bullatum]|nr:hypothetical protein HDU96_010686 [Phlyctochytrium bullatum]
MWRRDQRVREEAAEGAALAAIFKVPFWPRDQPFRAEAAEGADEIKLSSAGKDPEPIVHGDASKDGNVVVTVLLSEVSDASQPEKELPAPPGSANEQVSRPPDIVSSFDISSTDGGTALVVAESAMTQEGERGGEIDIVSSFEKWRAGTMRSRGTLVL